MTNTWYESLIGGFDNRSNILLNDSKTPSGTVHVGSLRGVLIHDILCKKLNEVGEGNVFSYGIDDYDPMDGLPSDAPESLKQYMGVPLCNIPPPEGSTASDMADHYSRDFLDLFPRLGVDAKVYRMRDVYRSGKINEAIDLILKNADVVREVYASVSGSIRPDNWYPFQVICENCGRIGTTEVFDYDGQEVSYRCRPDLVKWAEGCNHEGKISPFDGNGKLPWKLEWCAKWKTFGVDLEGSGKDHCTKGGSRDVADACYRRIFGATPPFNVPYEFFLVGGAKMSSSKGVGSSASDIFELLPAELIRYLMIRTPPKRTVNFSTDYKYLLKLFNDFDRLHGGFLKNKDGVNLFKDSMINGMTLAAEPVSFSLLVALLQLPHLEVESEIRKRSSTEYTDTDAVYLQKRINTAGIWIEHYASDEEKLVLQDAAPASMAELSDTQLYFLDNLGEWLSQNKNLYIDADGAEDILQTQLFKLIRTTPIEQKKAFQAIYISLFDKLDGPRAGSLLAYMSTDFIVDRFHGTQYSMDGYLTETGLSRQGFSEWVQDNRDTSAEYSVSLMIRIAAESAGASTAGGRGVAMFNYTAQDGKQFKKNILVSEFDGSDTDLSNEKLKLRKQTSDLFADADVQVDIGDVIHVVN